MTDGRKPAALRDKLDNEIHHGSNGCRFAQITMHDEPNVSGERRDILLGGHFLIDLRGGARGPRAICSNEVCHGIAPPGLAARNRFRKSFAGDIASPQRSKKALLHQGQLIAYQCD
ncbi:hypothetical protein [Labrys sp. 22185]|uniref:hypothetical protein n=1 Tax=Labrys sp. 22185 TaxID=3453888 RepID=UPI003F843378